MKDDQVPVSDTDALTSQGGLDADRTRRLGEFGRTNSPLSAAEIDERKSIALQKAQHGRLHADRWTPRRAGNIHDMKPEPER